MTDKIACFQVACKSGKKYIGCTNGNDIENMKEEYEEMYEDYSGETCTFGTIEKGIQGIDIRMEKLRMNYLNGVIQISD